MPKREIQEWPAMRYNEAGAHRVFERAEDVPEGWFTRDELLAGKAEPKPKKPAAKKAKKSNKAAPKDDIADDALFGGEATREEVIDTLKEKQIEVDENLSNRELEAYATEKLELGTE